MSTDLGPMNDRAKQRVSRALLLVLLTALFHWPREAQADSGVAFVELGLFHLTLLGLFILWLEAWILKRETATRFGRALFSSALGNLASYLAGLPVLWAVSNAGPLYPKINQYENLALSVALFLGLFGLTCLVEGPLFKWSLRTSWRQALEACVKANVVSYLILLPLMGPFSFFPNYGVRNLYRGT